MKKKALILALSGIFILCTQAAAQIQWEPATEQWRYAVVDNGGYFFLAPQTFQGGYLTGESSSAEAGNYSDVISLTHSPAPLQGIFTMSAGAQGPDGGVSPGDGLQVQGFAQMTLNNFNPAVHGVLVTQSVVVWVTREFTVDEGAEYSMDAVLGGTVNFNEFQGTAQYHFASYNLRGTATINAFKVEGGGALTALPWQLPHVTVDTVATPQSTTVFLVPQTSQGENVVYQLRAYLEIETGLQNFSLSTFDLQGPVTGPFTVGEDGHPIDLQVSLSEAGPLPDSPQFGYVPASVGVPCKGSYAAADTGYAWAIGGCGDYTNVVTQQNTWVRQPDGKKIITRTWKATDKCSHSVEQVQTIVIDTCPTSPQPPLSLLLGNP